MDNIEEVKKILDKFAEGLPTTMYSVYRKGFTQQICQLFELPEGKPPDIQDIAGNYYRECNASNPPKTYLAMEIAELIAQAYIKYYKG